MPDLLKSTSILASFALSFALLSFLTGCDRSRAIATDKTTPAGKHGTFCQVIVTHNGETIYHNVGGGEFRVDVPLPPKATTAAAPVAAPAPVVAAPVVAKRLTRLEQLRLEQEQREKAEKKPDAKKG